MWVFHEKDLLKLLKIGGRIVLKWTSAVRLVSLVWTHLVQDGKMQCISTQYLIMGLCKT